MTGRLTGREQVLAYSVMAVLLSLPLLLMRSARMRRTMRRREA
jgi:hypothetical protein